MPVGGRPSNLSSCQRKLSPAVKQSLFNIQLDATVIGSESGVGPVAPVYNHGGLPRRKSSKNRTKSRSSSACVFRSLNCFRNSNDDDESDTESDDHHQAPETSTTTTPTNPPTKMHGPTLPQKRLELRRQRQGSMDTHSMGQSVTTVDSDETVKHHNQSARTQRTVATSGSASTTKSTTTTTTRKRNLKKSIKKKSASDKYPRQ